MEDCGGGSAGGDCGGGDHGGDHGGGDCGSGDFSYIAPPAFHSTGKKYATANVSHDTRKARRQKW